MSESNPTDSVTKQEAEVPKSTTSVEENKPTTTATTETETTNSVVAPATESKTPATTTTTTDDDDDIDPKRIIRALRKMGLHDAAEQVQAKLLKDELKRVGTATASSRSSTTSTSTEEKKRPVAPPKKGVCPHQAEIGSDEPCMDCQVKFANEAEAYYNELKNMYGVDHDDTLSAALDLFTHFIQAYRLVECDKLLTEVAEPCMKRGRDSQAYIQHIQALSFLRFKQFRFRESAAIFEEMLTLVGPSTNLLENMGHAYNSCGEYEKAEESFQKALAIIDSKSLAEQMMSNKGGILLGLGVVKSHRGAYEDALPILIRAKDWYQARHKGDHSLVAKAGSSVAGALEALGRLKEAEAQFRECVRIFRLTCGDSSPLTAGALVKHGNILFSMQNFPEAETVLLEALQRNSEMDVYSITVSTVAELLLRVSDLLSKTEGKRKSLAPKLAEMCNEIDRKIKLRGAPENGDTAVFYKQWAEECFLSGDTPNSLRLFTESLRILKTVPGPESASLQSTCSFWIRLLQSPDSLSQLIGASNK